ARILPPGENAIDGRNGRWLLVKVALASPVDTSQIVTLLFQSAQARRRPLDENACGHCLAALWSARVFVSRPASTSQRITSPPSRPMANVLPSGESRQCPSASGSSCGAVARLVAKSHILNSPG